MNDNLMTEELNELREYLMMKGYKVWETESNEYPNVQTITQKLQKRVDFDKQHLPVCSCNDKLLINIDICQAKVHGKISVTAEMSLVHANSKDEWCNLSLYSLKPNQIYGYGDLEAKEDKLLEMWEIFYNED